MFERFTDRARNVVVLAQDEARMLNHNYIGTEHILLGLIHESQGLAAHALESLGIGLEPARQQVAEIVGRGKKSPSGHIPFTPRAKKILELSLREALQLSHNYIGTEHILLGLIREGEGVAVEVLVNLGADLKRVRQEVIQLQADSPITEEMPQGSRGRVSGRAHAATQATQATQAAQAEAARAAIAQAEAARAEARAENTAQARKLDEILDRLDSISDRLAVIERTLNPGTAADDD
jgi:ATP-dependent Clp protease ATP-binding subunit ClpC